MKKNTVKMQPKVSVIVPIYGVEKYLNQCVDSIIAQTLKDIEIILVDDGSKDKCPQIVDEYAKKDKRIVAVHQPNGGYGRAVNHGIELATGEYIGIVESDDWIDATMYEKLYQQAKKLNAEICKASFWWVTDSRKNEMWKFMPYLSLAPKGEIFNLKTRPALFKDHSSLWSAIYRKDFFDKNHIKLQESAEACYQDWPFCADVYSVADRITMLPEPLYFYRNDIDNTNSSSQIKSRKLIKIIDQCLIAREILIKNSMFTKEIQEAFYRQAFGASFGFFNKIAIEYKEEFFVRLQELYTLILASGLDYKYFNRDNINFMNAVVSSESYKQFCMNNTNFYKSKIIIKLFSCIPLCSVKLSDGKSVYKIFGIPVLKKRKMANGITTKYYLLGIPLLKVSRKDY